MIRTFMLLRMYIVRSLLQWLAVRSFLLTLVVDQAVVPVLGLVVWTRTIPGDPSVAAYFLAILLVQLATVSYEHHTLANGIYDGSLSHLLLRPHSALISFVSENLALRLLHLLFGMPVYIFLLVQLDVGFEPTALMIAIPSLVFAAVIRFLFTWSLATVAFWTNQAHGVVGFGEVMIYLLGGSAIPIVFFPDATREIVNWLPFRAMLGFPAEVASGSIHGSDVMAGYAMQGMWLIIWFGFGSIVWRHGLRRFSAVGG